MDSRIRARYKIKPQLEGPAQARRIIAEERSARVPAPVLDDLKVMGCSVRGNEPKYGSNGKPRDVTWHTGARSGACATDFPSPPVTEGIRQTTDASSPVSVISRRRARARRKMRETCICDTPISSAI